MPKYSTRRWVCQKVFFGSLFTFEVEMQQQTEKGRCAVYLGYQMGEGVNIISGQNMHPWACVQKVLTCHQLLWQLEVGLKLTERSSLLLARCPAPPTTQAEEQTVTIGWRGGKVCSPRCSSFPPPASPLHSTTSPWLSHTWKLFACRCHFEMPHLKSSWREMSSQPSKWCLPGLTLWHNLYKLKTHSFEFWVWERIPCYQKSGRHPALWLLSCTITSGSCIFTGTEQPNKSPYY